MKQLLLILSIALLTIGCSPERYSIDEVTMNTGILLIDGTPVDGIVFAEFENGQLLGKRNYKDGELISEKWWDKDGELLKDENY